MVWSMSQQAALTELLMPYNQTDTAVHPDTTFAELGMDNCDMVDFLLDVEAEYDIIIPNGAMFSCTCVQDVMDLIDRCLKEEKSNA